jgi:signal peptidase I
MWIGLLDRNFGQESPILRQNRTKKEGKNPMDASGRCLMRRYFVQKGPAARPGPVPKDLEPGRRSGLAACMKPTFTGAPAAKPGWRLFLWQEWIRPMAVAAAIVLPLKSSVASWSYVPSGSMAPTIVPLEFVWVNALAYDLKVPFTRMHVAEWGAPARGDVVTFISPADGLRLVKRVVGLPGDTVELRNEALWINGAPLGYLPAPAGTTARLASYDRQGPLFAREVLGDRTHLIMLLPQRPALRSFGPVTVPAGQYFMMGDNRDDSNDSRFIGSITRERILGRSSRVILSFDQEHALLPRFGRFFQPIP